MDFRAVTFLSSFLLVIKGNLCISLSESLALSASVGQSQLNQFTVPAVIKPIVRFDSSNLAPQNIPNYSSSSLSYQQPPLPIIIDNVASSGSSNSLSNLLFLVFALKNNNNGGGGNCGGCNGGGCNCGGCNGGGCNCGGCNCNGCNNFGGGGSYPGSYDPYTPALIIPTDPFGNGVETDIIIDDNECIDEPLVIDNACAAYTLAIITASHGAEPNEIYLDIKPAS